MPTQVLSHGAWSMASRRVLRSHVHLAGSGDVADERHLSGSQQRAATWVSFLCYFSDSTSLLSRCQDKGPSGKGKHIKFNAAPAVERASEGEVFDKNPVINVLIK